ncbi:hypothetical protein ACFL6M_01980 [Candidatus Eisenbacteria bacterium]|uniref:Uncharacterized protein n=1 Tax=Eiseniibacteriota bacterium TaxID=2212470 RepID=A0ABV6YJJ3_UNCEI
MKKLATFLVLLAMAGLIPLGSASGKDQAERVLDRYFEAAGGLDRLKGLESVSIDAQIPSFNNYEYTMHLLSDGRFRVEAPDRTTVYNGRQYWQSFHGVVAELTGDDIDQYRDLDLRQTLLHGFITADGKRAELKYAGQKNVRGQVCELLTGTAPDGDKRTYYVNANTGLVDKIEELTPDEEMRELKNIYTFKEYQAFDGIVLATLVQGQCLTNGEQIQPLTTLAEIRLNESVDPGLFAKPESAVPPVTMAGGALNGEVVGISGGGSLITNITMDDLQKLGPEDGDTVVSEVKGHTNQLLYMNNLESFGAIGRGDYLAIFNGTPSLWLVKAYLGMVSDDSTYAIGDKVRLTVSK